MHMYCRWTVILFFLIQACNQPGSGERTRDMFTGRGLQGADAEASEVIYSLYLPTDISRLLEETGTNFMPGLLLPPEKIPLYENPEQIAQLLGALGVDMSYCRLFERIPESAEYYTQIELLADKLDLPDRIFEKYSRNLEEYFSEPDSLTGLIHTVYRETDSYFRENGMESLASLSLMGGWIEAMYIGAEIYMDKGIIEMGNRILQQKYALNSLVGLLGNFQESLLVRKNMHILNELREMYDHVEIRYAPEGFRIHPEEGKFHASASEIRYNTGTLQSICTRIISIRGEIIQ
ncbi:MAG: hypothetical protein R6U78_08305 [Bacteroidales bacterium]